MIVNLSICPGMGIYQIVPKQQPILHSTKHTLIFIMCFMVSKHWMKCAIQEWISLKLHFVSKFNLFITTLIRNIHAYIDKITVFLKMAFILISHCTDFLKMIP